MTNWQFTCLCGRKLLLDSKETGHNNDLLNEIKEKDPKAIYHIDDEGNIWWACSEKHMDEFLSNYNIEKQKTSYD